MRTIKFRAWDTKKKEMVYRFFNIDPTSGLCWYAHPLKDLSYVLLQFTGLLDKNGVEIYEGDIMKHDFSPGRTETIICTDENLIALIMKLRNYSRMNDLNDRFEVIGNIYENPELLTSKQ